MPPKRSLRLSAEAERKIRAARDWWLRKRDKAPNAFDEDLTHALKVITQAPGVGIVVKVRKSGLVRRILLPRAGFHLYYQAAPHGRIVNVITLWPAVSGKGPRL